jgi:hypothetical protein
MVLLRLLVAKKIAPAVTRRKDIGRTGYSTNIFPGGTARAEDPGLSAAREAAEAVPPGKRPLQWKSATSFFKDVSTLQGIHV